MYAYSGGISITGGSVEATGGSAEIISQDENATLYAESDGIDADNMNDSGGMSITGGSTVTATGGAAAVDGGDGIAYSYGISTYERITVEGSTVQPPEVRPRVQSFQKAMVSNIWKSSRYPQAP